MTQEAKEIVTKELIKGGIGFVVMAIVIYFLYKENSANNEQTRREVSELRAETKECTKSYQNLLLNQLEENTQTIKENNQIVEYYFKQKPKYENQR